MNLDQLREYANEAGHAIGSEVHKFIDWVEGKSTPAEKTVGELQAQQAAAGAPVAEGVAQEVPQAPQPTEAQGEPGGPVEAGAEREQPAV